MLGNKTLPVLLYHLLEWIFDSSAQAATALKEKTRNLVLLNVDEGARWCSNGIRAEKENGENLLCIFENIVILTYVTLGVCEGGVVCI